MMMNSVKEVSETSRLVGDQPLQTHRLTIWKNYRGLILGCVFSLLFSFVYLILKTLDERYHPVSIAFWRDFSNLILILCVLFCYQFVKGGNVVIFGSLCRVSRREKGILATALVIGGIAGAFARLISIWAQKYLSIGDSTIIHSAAPIFVVCFAACCLGEKCGFVLSGVVIFTFLGIVLMTRPPLLTGQISLDMNNFHGVGLALMAVFISAFGMIILRRLRNIHWILVLLNQSTFGTLVNLSLAGASGVLVLPVGQQDSLLAYVALPLAGFFAQISLVFAFKFEKAGPVSLVLSSGILFSFLLQFVFFGNVPDVYSWGGGAIVIFCIVITATRKWVEELPAEDDRKRKFQFIIR